MADGRHIENRFLTKIAVSRRLIGRLKRNSK